MLGLVSGLLLFKIWTVREPVISAGFFNRNRSKRVCLSNYKPYFNVLAESVSNTTPYAYFWSLINTRLFVCSFRLRRRKSWNGRNGSSWGPRSGTRYALLYDLKLNKSVHSGIWALPMINQHQKHNTTRYAAKEGLKLRTNERTRLLSIYVVFVVAFILN